MDGLAICWQCWPWAYSSITVTGWGRISYAEPMVYEPDSLFGRWVSGREWEPGGFELQAGLTGYVLDRGRD
ncbi:MAG: hypothetical protein ACLSEX_00385 [Blautia sp.]